MNTNHPVRNSLSTLFIGVCCLLILLWVWLPESNTSTPSQPDGNRVVATFAGKNITADDIHSAELARVQNLIANHHYTGSTRDYRQVADFAIYQTLDKIELQKQMQTQQEKSGITSNEAYNEIISKIAPAQYFSERESLDFYTTHPQLFARSEPFMHIEEIVTDSRAHAEAIRDKILSGSSFVSLAQQYSLDPPQYRNNGGDLGWLNNDQMSSEVSQVVFSLPLNTISTPFAVGKYYVMVQVLGGPQYDVIPYQDAAATIKGYMAKYNQQQALYTWLSQQIIRERLIIRDDHYGQAFHAAIDDLTKSPDQSDAGNL